MSTKSHKALTQWLTFNQKKPENQTCCECSARNPDWAFLFRSPFPDSQEDDHIGVFICFACSSAHKTLDESLGKVKSIAVGSWTTAEIRAMARGGNNHIVNQVFESDLSTRNLKPTEDSGIMERSLFLEMKYGQRKFYCPTKASHQLIQTKTKTKTSPSKASSSDEPSEHSTNSRRAVFSAFRQISLPSLGLSSPKSPSQSKRSKKGMRRVHSNDDCLLSPTSTGVYSISASTISTKSTLFTGGSGRSNHRIQIINESPFHEDLKTPPIMEMDSRHLLEFHWDNDEKNDTRPKMCQRMRSARTLGGMLSEEGESPYHYQDGRRTKSLDLDQYLGAADEREEQQLISRLEYGPTPVHHRRRGSMGGEQPPSSETGSVRRQGSMGSSRRGSMGGSRRGSMGSSRRGSMGGSRQGSMGSSRRGSMGGSRRGSMGSSRRGSMGGSRRTSSTERLNRREHSIDSKLGKERAALSRRHMSLERRNSMTNHSWTNNNSTPQQQERPKYTRGLNTSSMMRRHSITNSTPQGERPVLPLSMIDTSARQTPEAPQRQTWMEEKTPRTTGRRRSLGVDSLPSRRRNSLTGGANRKNRSLSRDSSPRRPRRNSMFGSQTNLSVSNHGAGPAVFRRSRTGSKRNFARQGSSKSLVSTDSEKSPIPSVSTASVRLRQDGLISGEKRSSSRGLESLRGSLGAQKSSDSDLTSSRLAASTQSTKPGSNIAVEKKNSKSSPNDLESRLRQIDRITSKEYISPLTASTASKRVPRSLHVVLCAESDENRTIVSNITGTTSLDSEHWSLHSQRWNA